MAPKKAPKNAPVFDYRPDHNGSQVASEKVRNTPKVAVKNADGKVKTLKKAPKVGEGGLHGGVLRHDKSGHSQIVYH